jgi:hypothetical protein
MNPISVVSNCFFRRTLQEKGPALTFARLCTSRHLGDLQWIAFLMILLALGALVIAIYSFHVGSFSVNSTVAGALAAAAAAVLNWTYQSGSRRIGAVDLFACEISVICRVSLVVDFARGCVERADRNHEFVERAARMPPQASSDDGLAHPEGGGQMKFTSEEHYTPVYDGQLSDLEPLDVNVVTYVTEFYTYRKSLMDYLRAISSATDVSERDNFMSQMIYMQFLMYESGRLAIGELIEFEPNRAESIVNILCSELVTYAYLLARHEKDYRGDRLRLRRQEYDKIVAELYSKIMKERHPSWEKAQTTAPELIRRYRKMCSDLGLEPELSGELAGPQHGR